MSHINEEKLNNQGCLMKVIEYINNRNIIVEFQDAYKARVHTTYGNFKSGSVKNPYYPTVFGVGIIGAKYPKNINTINIKEYETWKCILCRCYDDKTKNRQPAYNNVNCCNEWLNYENFYEWLHSQENFDRWLKLEKSALDKDILVKGNKIYSPDTCCLVPQNINNLLLKCDSARGNSPIGLYYDKETGSYIVQCCQNGHGDYKGSYGTLESAFIKYKNEKEKIIKEVATKEYNNGNITKKCYEALLEYEVEITD